MTMPDGAMLIGIAAVITSLTNLTTTLLAARKRGSNEKLEPRRVPRRRPRLVARERHSRPL